LLFNGHIKRGATRYYLICPKCKGDGCSECGSGLIQETGDISANLTGAGGELFAAYQWLKNYGTYPAPGTWTQQTAKFYRAITFCDSMSSKFHELRERKNAEMDAMIKGLKNGKYS